MNYNIQVRVEMGGDELRLQPTKVFKEFTAYGERFFVHNRWSWGWKQNGWFSVSHYSTGFSVEESEANTIEKAAKAGHHTIYGLGKVKVYKAVRRVLNKYGRANP